MRKILAFALILIFSISSFSYGDINGPYRNGYIEGYIKDKFNDKIQIEEYDGTLHTLSFTKDAYFSIDNRDAVISDFLPGMEIYATLQGRSINYMETYSTANPGYIKEGSKVRVGTVKKIDRDQIMIKSPIGKEETYFTTPATITLKKGKNIELNNLYEGDRVKLYFDQMDSTTISRIAIEGDSILVKNLYKGKINLTNDLDEKITLENVEYFKNGKWEKEKDMMTMPYSSDTPIYVGGAVVSYKNLKYYKGKTAYMVVKDFFGSDKIERLVVKSQYETTYSDKLEDINWYAESFELTGKQNIAFNDGTIIIKSGRLVDKYSLNPKSDAFVLADGRNGSMIADLVYVYNEDINNSNIGQNYVYSGKLEEIDKYSVILNKFYLLDKNEWVSFNEKKDTPLYYDEDTYIYDLDNNKKLKTSELFALDAENKNYYSYIYADGDRIASIFVQKHLDSLLKQRVTNGSVESIKKDSILGWTISLRDAKDWSDSKDKWMAKNSSINISVQKSMIIKEGKEISAEELNAGDRLYIIRDDIYGKVAIVK